MKELETPERRERKYLADRAAAIQDLVEMNDKAIAHSASVDHNRIAVEMGLLITDMINTYEEATGWTVDSFEITRASDHRSVVIDVKPFVFFSIPNRQIIES